jgi:hypothetical protein
MQSANVIPILDWQALAAWAAGYGEAPAVARTREQGRHAWLVHFRELMGPHS